MKNCKKKKCLQKNLMFDWGYFTTSIFAKMIIRVASQLIIIDAGNGITSFFIF